MATEPGSRRTIESAGSSSEIVKTTRSGAILIPDAKFGKALRPPLFPVGSALRKTIIDMGFIDAVTIASLVSKKYPQGETVVDLVPQQLTGMVDVKVSTQVEMHEFDTVVWMGVMGKTVFHVGKTAEGLTSLTDSAGQPIKGKYVASGIIDEETVQVNPGDIFIIPAGVLYRRTTDETAYAIVMKSREARE